MTDIVEKAKSNPISATLHGLSAAAIVWMFATFGTKAHQDELRNRVRVLESELPALRERVKAQRDLVLFIVRGETQAEFDTERERYE